MSINFVLLVFVCLFLGFNYPLMNKMLNLFFFIKAKKHSYTNFGYYLLVILMLEGDLERTGISSDDFVTILCNFPRKFKHY